MMASTTTAVNDNHVASSQADISDLEEESTSLAGAEEEELEEIKARVREMEEEAAKLKQMQDEITSQNQSEPSTLTPEERVEIDARSIFVGNVDYSATADDLEKHFHGCGSINRVTILCDKYTGHPKGFAYIEFAEKDSVETATALDDSLFKGRQIKVTDKRTNRPGLSSTNRPPRGGRGGGGGGGGGGRGRGGYMGGGGGGGYGGGRGMWHHPRGGRRPFRGRGWHGYSPY